MDSIPHIHLDEISPETAKMLARGCKQNQAARLHDPALSGAGN